MTKLLNVSQTILLALCTLPLTAMSLRDRDLIITQDRMQPHLQYSYFSIDRPPNKEWAAVRDEQHPYSALFRRRTGSESHTLVVAVKFKKIPRRPTSPEDFKEMTRAFFRFEDTARFEAKELSLETGGRQGQWCVFFQEKIVDHKAPKGGGIVLVGRGRGFVCMHPSLANTVVFADCTERGFENELNDALFAEGVQTVNSVVLESASGKPVDR